MITHLSDENRNQIICLSLAFRKAHFPQSKKNNLLQSIYTSKKNVPGLNKIKVDFDRLLPVKQRM